MLRRHKFVKLKLAVEAGDIDLIAAAEAKQIFIGELHEVCTLHDIPMERKLNADQVGLYHQKLTCTVALYHTST